MAGGQGVPREPCVHRLRWEELKDSQRGQGGQDPGEVDRDDPSGGL